jgi:hypothetical protein
MEPKLKYKVVNPKMRGHSSYCEGVFPTRQKAVDYIAEHELQQRKIIPTREEI